MNFRILVLGLSLISSITMPLQAMDLFSLVAPNCDNLLFRNYYCRPFYSPIPRQVYDSALYAMHTGYNALVNLNTYRPLIACGKELAKTTISLVSENPKAVATCIAGTSLMALTLWKANEKLQAAITKANEKLQAAITKRRQACIFAKEYQAFITKGFAQKYQATIAKLSRVPVVEKEQLETALEGSEYGIVNIWYDQQRDVSFSLVKNGARDSGIKILMETEPDSWKSYAEDRIFMPDFENRKFVALIPSTFYMASYTQNRVLLAVEQNGGNQLNMHTGQFASDNNDSCCAYDTTHSTIQSLTLSKSGAICAFTTDHELIMLDLNGKAIIKQIKQQHFKGFAQALSPDGILYVQTLSDGSLEWYSFEGEEDVLLSQGKAWVARNSKIDLISVSPDKKYIVLAYQDGFVTLVDTGTSERICWKAHKSALDVLDFTLDSTKVVTGSHQERCIKKWGI